MVAVVAVEGLVSTSKLHEVVKGRKEKVVNSKNSEASSR